MFTWTYWAIALVMLGVLQEIEKPTDVATWFGTVLAAALWPAAILLALGSSLGRWLNKHVYRSKAHSTVEKDEGV